MRVADPVHLCGWRAELALGFESREGRSVLATRRHDGPLVVQKPLYPEGDAVCHVIVVHPPAGVAGGDELEIEARLAQGTRALLTTPGAGKWYRSAGAWARQHLVFEAERDACLEWLPQETIVFDGALAEMSSEVRLAANSVYIGWEILCFGRTGSGERYATGECRPRTRLWRDGRLQWFERGRIEAGGLLARSPAGLAARPVCGTLLAAAPGVSRDLVAACRSERPVTGEAAVTLLPGLIVARYLGTSGEAARAYFAGLWRRLRPALSGREAVVPRIWNT